MNAWIKSILIALSAAMLTFLISKVLIKRNHKVLEGHFVLKIEPDKTFTGLSEMKAVKTISEVIHNRLQYGGFEPVTTSIDEFHFKTVLRNVPDSSFLEEIFTTRGSLEFLETYTIEIFTKATPALQNATEKYFPRPVPRKPVKRDSTPKKTNKDLSKISETVIEEEPLPYGGISSLIEFSNPYQSDHSSMVFPAQIGTIKEKDSAIVNKILNDSVLRASLPADLRFYYGNLYNAEERKEKDKQLLALYAIRQNLYGNATIRNEDIAAAKAEFDERGRPIVSFTFKHFAAKKWERLTANNVGKAIAMVVDDKVISAPVVNSPITGGSSVINGAFTFEEARVLALQLSSDRLPGFVKIVESSLSPHPATVFPLSSLLLAGLGFLLTGFLSLLLFKKLNFS